MNEEVQIVWRGIVHDLQGYARASREYILALDEIGMDVKIQPINYGTTATKLPKDKTTRLKRLIEKPLALDKKKILIFHAQPYGIDPEQERRNGFDKVIINTVWETTKIPDNWFPNINKADAVFVPSKENIIALRNSGVDVPVFLVPHGADTLFFNQENEKLPLKEVEDLFTFLSVFKWEHRKAPEKLLLAYWNEFTSEDKVALILKTYWGDGSKKSDQRMVMDRITHFKHLKGFTNTAPIFFTGSQFSDEDMRALYPLADVFVLPSRGEGVGLPYIEALCNSIPVIATNWGGQTDFVNEDNGYLVNYELETTGASFNESIAPHYNQIFTDNMTWANPSIDHLQERMREAYENQEQAKAKGLQGRKDMEQMSWTHSALSIKKALKNLRGV